MKIETPGRSEKTREDKAKTDKPKVDKFKVNTLAYIANEHIKKLTDESEIETQDLTDVFYAELDMMVKEGELIIINITGKVRLGKSTEAIALGWDIYELLKKHGQRKKHERFTIENIARDQLEYSQLMRNPEVHNTAMVIDESNELEKGGENSSAEASLLKVLSDVQAARYVHTVWCSPAEINNPNADILLEVQGIDKEKRVTHNKLYYRMYRGGQEVIQFIGYVNIPVGHVIKNWEDKAKNIFRKTERTPQDEMRLQKLRESDFFVEYNCLKHEKMELITKEGIMRPRMLQYAGVTLKVIERLKPITRSGFRVSKNVVRNYVKIETEKAKIPTSIIGIELGTGEVMGIIELYHSYYKIQKDVEKLQKAVDEGALSLTAFYNRKKELEDISTDLARAIDQQLTQLRKYESINEVYNIRKGDPKAVKEYQAEQERLRRERVDKDTEGWDPGNGGER